MSARSICQNFNAKELLQVIASYIIQFRLYETKVCTDCHSSCYECHGDASNQCLSCPAGKYLSHNSAGSLSGQCLDVEDSNLSVSIFVTSGSQIDTADGSYANPYDHIVRALSAGMNSLAQYRSGTLNIYLLAGNHYMTSGFNQYYYPTSKSNKYSLNYDITIQPVF